MADYLPESLRGQRFYQPGDHGYEKEIAKRLDGWRRAEPPRPDKEPPGDTN